MPEYSAADYDTEERLVGCILIAAVILVLAAVIVWCIA